MRVKEWRGAGRTSRWIRSLAIAAITLSLPVAASAGGDWQTALGQQLLAQENCTVELLLNVREMEIGGVATVSGRATCSDKHSFDFSRLHPDDPFELQACDIQVC
jgi:hypothetical protein